MKTYSNMMTRISACLVVRNEEKFVRNCLESIKDIVDEIIVVDGDSTDKTVEICKEYTDKIYFRKPQGFVEPDRIFALEKATGDWILVIDADETLSKELRGNLRYLTQQGDYSAYAFTRRHYYDKEGKKWTKYVFYPDYQIRLFRAGKAKYAGMIHESPKVDGKTKNASLKWYINHHVPNHYSFATFKKRHLRFAKIQAKQTERTKPRVFYFIKAIVAFYYSFIKNFSMQRWFLDGVVGLKASLVMASYFFMVNYYVATGD